MTLQTTVGQLLVNQGLPEDLRDYERVLDKKGIRELMAEAAKKHPDDYSKILRHIMDSARSFASVEGASVSLQHLRTAKSKQSIIKKLQRENQKDIDNPQLSDDEREKRIVARTAKIYGELKDAVLAEELGKGSPYAVQTVSGAKGNPGQVSSLVGADLLVADHQNRPVPMPIYSSYGEGLDPVEYWAAGYGTRKGMVDVKFAVADAGYLSKQLSFAAQRQVVSHNKPNKYRLPVGLPVSIDDPDNEGGVLAVETAGYPEGTVLTPRVLEDIRRKAKTEKILIHSPMTSIHEDGGIDQWSAGVRERGRMAEMGDNTGIVAAQSLGEPMAQGMLDSKHSVGVGGSKAHRGGFEYLNKLLQAPETFTEAGPLAPIDGVVTGIQEAPQGGHFIHIGDKKIFVRPELNVTVKEGQKLEQGDDLTDGVPHPSDLVRYRGVGEARRVYLSNLLEAVSNSGLPLHRRNAESLVAAAINHARVTDPDGFHDHLIDSVVPYNTLMARYKAREGAKRLQTQKAVGRYLEEPALHYTPGTRINSRIAKELQEFGVQDVETHDQPPPFEPQFERLLTNTSHDPDWQTRLGGFYIGRSLMKSLHEGATSDSANTSFMPALAQGQRFGKDLKVQGRY